MDVESVRSCFARVGMDVKSVAEHVETVAEHFETVAEHVD